ncbi:MAG: hypothetical protein DHS20C02_13570 [Micavibrio sp.]|nr:MAG: hypothetical protein DHS20C02_13570 [Micavibrio sp.]
MAQARIIKHRSKRGRKKKSPALSFLPDFVQAFAARRFVDMTAGFLFVSGIFILLALFSYNHNDPSWNTAAAQGQDIANWGGTPGAGIADLLLQTLGGGGFIIGLVFSIWGIRMFRRHLLAPLWTRMVSLMVASICTAIALAQIPAGDWMVHPYLGSSAGTIIMGHIVSLAQSLGSGWGSAVIALMAGIIAFATLLHACAVTRDEISFAFYEARHWLLTGVLFMLNICQHFYAWLRHYNEPEHALPKMTFFDKFQKPQARKEPVIRAPMMNAPENYAPPPQAPLAKTPPTIPVVTPARANPVQQAAPADTQQRFALSDTGEWEYPPLSLIQEPPAEVLDSVPSEDVLRKNAELLQNVLADFNIQGDIVSIHPGPVVTLYELEPAPGVKTSRVISLSDDIARSMSAVSVRCAVVPGRNVIGIELPNKTRQIVYMRELLASSLVEKSKAKLPLILGKDIGGQPILADLAKMPHLLVAGTTGSGKSVAVNTMLMSLLFRLPPEKCRLIMIDPKMLELSVYDDIPHLLSPVVTEPGKAVVALKWAVQEMEERYRAMSKLGVRNIEGYNERLAEARKKGEDLMRKIQTGFDPETGKPIYEEQPMDLTELPYIVIVVDEFADLMLVAGKDVESAIQRLAQMARAAGIHLIMATQRPSVDVITGVIKANFPTRISFQVTSKIDSRTILGDGGAEQLLGMGDMLYMAPGGRITRVHGPFVSDGEVEDIVNFLKAQSEPAYIESVTEASDFGDSEVMNAMFGEGEGGSNVDELYDQAVALVAREGKASTSFVQRYLQIGYNRAARIVEEMERQGVISPASATGKRDVLIQDFSDV